MVVRAPNQLSVSSSPAGASDTRRSRYPTASDSESARKKIHAKHTRWKVTMAFTAVDAHLRQTGGSGFANASTAREPLEGTIDSGPLAGAPANAATPAALCTTGLDDSRADRCARSILCADRYTPCRPPQMTNVQLAPCHRPPSSIVSIRLR